VRTEGVDWSGGARIPREEGFYFLQTQRPRGWDSGAGLAAPAPCCGCSHPSPAHKAVSWEGGGGSATHAQRLLLPEA
jgi:hypothetical protein